MKSNPFAAFSMKDKVVILTGGVGLLGKAYAEILVLAGAQLIIWDNKERDVLHQFAVELFKKTGCNSHVMAVDITSEEQVMSEAARVHKIYGRIDVLINNAAINPAIGNDETKNPFAPYDQYPTDLFRKEMDVNVTGTHICSKAVAPFMKEQKSGVIVNVASDVALGAYDNRIYRRVGWNERWKSPAYVTSKTAIPGLTKQWAEFLGPYGVRVICFSPAGVQTPSMTPEFVASYAQHTMFGRMARVDEYAALMLFLCSDASSYMTGSNVIADGGKSAW